MKSRNEFDSDESYKKYLKTYFAAKAMQGLMSNPQYLLELKQNYEKKVITDLNFMLVRESLDVADELLKQLES